VDENVFEGIRFRRKQVKDLFLTSTQTRVEKAEKRNKI